MIFIDAFNIKTGGALELLIYFVKYLEEKAINYEIGLNPKIDLDIDKNKIVYKEVNMFKRKAFYREELHVNKLTSIFCFGNYPPPIKLKPEVNVVTLIHNLFLIEKKTYGKLKKRIMYNFKMLYLSHIINNTNFFVFQSNFLKKLFFNNYNFPENKCLSLPFFDEENIRKVVLNKNQKKESGFVYISAYNDHKNHKRLINVWKRLKQDKIDIPLYLTVDKALPFNKIIQQVNKNGVGIINLGSLSHSDCLDVLAKNKYSIFPSIKETFGLGLMEAQLAGAKVLASDLPYVDEIIEPSVRFNPFSEDDIFIKIKEFLLNENKKDTKLIVQNKIKELVELIDESKKNS